MNDMHNTFNDTIKMSLFYKLKTNNPIIDAIVSAIVLTLMSYIVKVGYDYNITTLFSFSEMDIFEQFKYCFYKKNTISLSGKKCSSVSRYTSKPVISSVMSNRFKAVWQEIVDNIDNNPSIYELKDFFTLTPQDEYNNDKTDDANNKDDNIYIVLQTRAFLFNDKLKIYAKTKIMEDDNNSDKEKRTSKIDTIDIILYSYQSSMSQIKSYIEQLTNQYTEKIEIQRNNKRFMYTLVKTKFENDRFECWKETVFDTTRSFDNMFFDCKADVLKKINFFLNNKDWYYRKGIPYTLGIGLHGDPGTGKTSLMKSLAVMTGRHIKSISFKLLKTRRQLHEFFFESRYCEHNKKNSIGFSEKIIVIEDIDAQGDIVLDRSKKNKIAVNSSITNALTEQVNIAGAIQHILNTERDRDRDRDRDGDRDRDRDRDRDKDGGRCSDKSMISTVFKPVEDDLITLDDILNLWDGLEETAGRILVISSNHYNDLDPALTRPGRIDITIEMKNASHEIIAEMYQHLFETKIDAKILEKVTPLFYSPAEIVNLYLMYKDDANEFMERLILNKKV